MLGKNVVVLFLAKSRNATGERVLVCKKCFLVFVKEGSLAESIVKAVRQHPRSRSQCKRTWSRPTNRMPCVTVQSQNSTGDDSHHDFIVSLSGA